MRIGLFGVGRIGQSHAEAAAAQPGISALILADLNPEAARSAAKRLSQAHPNLEISVATSVAQAFELGLDGVLITSGTASHAELIALALKHSVPVFCEKPVAATIEGTVDIKNLAAESGVPVSIGFQRRFDRGYRTAREALRSGQIGDLRRIHALTCDPHPPAPEYIPLSGGIYRDCLIHDFDAIAWMTGRRCVEVTVLGTDRGVDFFKTAGDVAETVCMLKLDDGTLATLHASRFNGAGYDARMEIAGTHGTLAVGLDDHSALVSCEEGTVFPTEAPWTNFWDRFSDAYFDEISAFIGTIAGRTSPACTVEEALEAAYVAEAATISLRENRRVEIDEVRR